MKNNSKMEARKIINIIALTAILLVVIVGLTSAVTITGQASSYTFDLANCSYSTNYEPLNCSQSNIRFQCDINPTNFVDTISFRVNNVNYATTQNSTNPTQFYLLYTKTNEITSNNDNIIFDRQTITDVDTHSVNAFETISVNHSCATCDVTFTTSLIQNCNTSNQKITQYTTSNASCQPSYTLTESCDYCSPNLIANTTSCSINNSKTTTYQDLSYNLCCLNTGLVEDCPTLTPPYNIPLIENCNYYQNDMLCSIDTQPIISDKINVNCELPSNEDGCCLINTYQNQNNTRVLLATTPQYKQTSTSIIALSTEQETRNCFPTTNRLMNGYYTSKELRPNTTYEIEITCSTNTTSYKTITSVTPEYHTPDEIIYRLQWIGNNPTKFILITLVAILFIIIAIILIGKLKRGKI